MIKKERSDGEQFPGIPQEVFDQSKKELSLVIDKAARQIQLIAGSLVRECKKGILPPLIIEETKEGHDYTGDWRVVEYLPEENKLIVAHRQYTEEEWEPPVDPPVDGVYKLDKPLEWERSEAKPEDWITYGGRVLDALRVAIGQVSAGREADINSQSQWVRLPQYQPSSERLVDF